MRFLRDAVITILLLAIVAVTAAFVVARRGGLAASAEPGRLERAVAGGSSVSRFPLTPIDKRARSADRPKSGVRRVSIIWITARCATAVTRRATPRWAPTFPKVPDLTATQVQQRSDGALFYIIQNGIRWTGMPAWKEEHSPEETWKLVALIRKAPTLTEADMKIEEPVATTGEKPGKEAPPHQHRR